MREFILAIEAGGTKLQMAIGSAQGEILYNYRTTVDREKGFQGILDVFMDAMPSLNAKAKELGGTIRRLGIGFGGPVDTVTGTVIWSAQIEGWGGFPVKKFFEEKTGIPTCVFNDSDAAAWGEYCKGAGQGSHIFFYTNMGSGVGGGIVINGSLFTGHGYGATEFGQSYLYNPFHRGDGYPVTQVEKLCSGWGIERRLRREHIPETSVLWELCQGEQEKLNCPMWGEGIRRGDAYSLKVLEETCELFSIGLSNVICLFSPDTIAVGGGVSLIGEPLIQGLNRCIKKYVYKNSLGRYKIVKSQLGESIVLVGVLLLAGAEI